jgi:hypothetical protein
MRKYDLAIAWNWEFDREFIFGIERECHHRSISTYRIDTEHLPTALKQLKEHSLKFLAFFDRASDADPEFLPLVQWMEEHVVYYINPHHRVVYAIDKATMHLEFISRGLYVPDTIILPPYNERKDYSLKESDLGRLGKPFIIKPANTTGGGTGVKLHAKTIEDVLRARQEHKNDKYLVQQMIHPRNLDGKRAWFRVYYTFGEIIPCWWDDKTHKYTILLEEDERRYQLNVLREIMRTIQSVCRLDFFSSEIATTDEGQFVVVDYVNEVCDMRLQSHFPNGAPDTVVHHIESLIAGETDQHLKNSKKQSTN